MHFEERNPNIRDQRQVDLCCLLASQPILIAESQIPVRDTRWVAEVVERLLSG